jgi:hypothetical protein
MKIKLTCVYGEANPGDEIDVSADQGKWLIEIGAGSEMPQAIKPTAKPTKDESGGAKL